MNKIIKIGLSIAVIALLGIGGIKTIKKARAKDNATPKAKIYPIVINTISPKITHVKLTLPYIAEVQNDKDVTLSSKIAESYFITGNYKESLRYSEPLFKQFQ